MKKEDFERLKAVCEKAGFELLVIAKKKDIWDGVEFFISSWSGKIFRRDQIDDIDIKNHNGHLSPSTESAYLEQLKKEAFERFGEIKLGDRFDTGYGINSIIENLPEWFYNKNIDFLYYKGLIVYSKGKWATRVKERVKVDSVDLYIEVSSGGPYLIKPEFSIINVKEYDKNGVMNFLASQLEKYLNNEIE